MHSSIITCGFTATSVSRAAIGPLVLLVNAHPDFICLLTLTQVLLALFVLFIGQIL